MRNFVLHIDEIKSARDKSKIVDILAEYVQCVKGNDYSFDRVSSAELATSYLFPLINYYQTDSKFMRVIKLQEVLILGLLVDSILFLTGLLSHFRYIPISTCILFMYYTFLMIFKIPQGRVYGMFY
jgi:hypothetical protein